MTIPSNDVVKKSKKNKKRAQQEAAATEPADELVNADNHENGHDESEELPNGVTDGNSPASLEKQKKDKKKKKKKLQDAESNGMEVDDAAAAAVETIGETRKRAKAAADDDEDGAGKKKKKKSKVEAAVEENGTKTAGKESKKSKKHTSSSSTRAEVGDHSLADTLPPIVKGVYKETSKTAALSQEEVAKLREERGITVEARSAACDMKPILSFEDTGLSEDMLHATRTFVQPSPIQSQCWPIIMAGHDLVGVAATGSGKTLAFGLPALQHIAKQKEAKVFSSKGPFALVMAPTRELAQQIADVLMGAGEKCNCSCLCVYGGVPKQPQAKVLKKGVDILVGTPGRLEDLMNDGTCKLNETTYLVLDEADRMLDLGFEPHIRAIVNHIRSDRQTLMFSATWPTAVQKLAATFLCNAVKVTIGSHNLAASHSVKQVVEVMEPRARDERLLSLLKQHHKGQGHRCIIFVLYKKEAPRVESLLNNRGFKAAAIHGDITQDKRNRAVEQFKAGTVPLLVATDVAARGLDIPDVEIVVNYSFPLTTEDYVHRIGRTGRAGKKGVAYTFFCGINDKQRAGELINVLKEAGQAVPEELLKFGTTVKKKESKLYGAHFKDVDVNAKASKITFDSDDDN